MYRSMAEDIKMNQFQIVSDAPYVYVELADGSQGKIKKEDLTKLISDSIASAKPKTISTKRGIEVDTGITGTHIVSIWYNNRESAYEYIFRIYFNNNEYHTEVLVSTWYSNKISIRMDVDRLYITQNNWDNMELKIKVL